MKTIIGLVLIVAVVGVGFIRIDEATWLAWRAAWLLGAGGGMGIGIGLILVDQILLPSHKCRSN